MGFWNKKPTPKFDPLDQLKGPSKSEYAWLDELKDVKSDIENINLLLNGYNRRFDDIEIILRSVLERNSDAIELKESFMAILEALNYVKVHR